MVESTLSASKIWWYEFEFRGVRIRESSYSNNKALAQRIERERRRSLELGTAGLKDTAKPLRFADAAKSYVADREAHWAPKTRRTQSKQPGPPCSLTS